MTTENKSLEGTPSAVNPLEEVPPTSLNELFDRDPLSLTKSDISQIVEAFRSQRGQWAREELQGKGEKKGKTKITDSQIKLDDLDISL